jgi:beta-phosphoglucomutase
MFLIAAQELGTTPAVSFVIEDAAAGVQAAKAGNMAALGLARADDAELLAKANADLVVTTLDDVDLDALADARLVSKEARPSA